VIEEKVRIVIEFSGRYQKDDVSDARIKIQQALMCRNPLDEPYIRCQRSKDGKRWKDDDSI